MMMISLALSMQRFNVLNIFIFHQGVNGVTESSKISSKISSIVLPVSCGVGMT